MTGSEHRLGEGLRRQLANLGNRLSRARYFRGHGVHSPYIYSIVREVFMPRRLLAGEHTLYEQLVAHGIARHRAVQLQNLAIHCGYATSGLNCATVQLCVLTADLPIEQSRQLIREAAAARHTVVLLDPYKGRERRQLCAETVAAHPSTSVDKRAYIVLFNNHLPKQHFSL